MRCSSCGALYSDAEFCTECGTSVLNVSKPNGEHEPPQDFESAPAVRSTAVKSASKSTLIEFPGVTRSTVPEWRRVLSERVRVAQERRAREAAREAAEAERRRLLAEKRALGGPQLELRSQTTTSLNPLVVAALRRIERANYQPLNPPAPVAKPKARAVAAAAEATAVAPVKFEEPLPTFSPIAETPVQQPEAPRNLVPVKPAAREKVIKPESAPATKKLLREDNGVLDYLIEVPAPMRVGEIREKQAGWIPRVGAGSIDLAVWLLLFSPFAAVVELVDGDWLTVTTALAAAGFGAVIIFAYLTLCTALTGRTLGMRVLSLRTVDRKTGLIPTGTQSVGRAIIFVASLFALGLPVVYVFINSEGQTPHDYLSGTAVVHA